MKRQFVNAKVVTPEGIIDSGVVRTDGDIIEYVGAQKVIGVQTVDLMGNYLLPGFIDIHCHGGGGYDFMDATADEMRKISRYHLAHGTTTLVATTMTDTDEAIFAALDRFALLGDDRVTLHGVHLEGPWLSAAQCGAQDVSKMSKPSKENLERILDKYPFVERISAAPEVDPGYEVGLKGKERGIVVAAAHTDCDFDTMLEAVDKGYTLVTHLYSGMRGVVRVNAYRVAGCIEAGLYDDRLTVEVICDGKHLPHSLLKLIYKCKGADRICLITDGIRGAGLPDGTEFVSGRREDGVPAIIEDGVGKMMDRQAFVGSVATTDRLLWNMVNLGGAPIEEVSKMMSKTPARVMGYTDRGTIEVGKRADLVIVTPDLSVESVYLAGERV
nr:N-acetylglucosamine-6-phosphate deacetylase [Oscillospiraceae bacterium]